MSVHATVEREEVATHATESDQHREPGRPKWLLRGAVLLLAATVLVIGANELRSREPGSEDATAEVPAVVPAHQPDSYQPESRIGTNHLDGVFQLPAATPAHQPDSYQPESRIGTNHLDGVFQLPAATPAPVVLCRVNGPC